MSVTLVSNDNKEFTIDAGIANTSGFIKTMIEDGLSGDSIPFPDISSNTLSKIVEFMQYYNNNPFEAIEKPLKSANLKQVVPDWYANFVILDMEELFALVTAANYIDLKPLLDLTCAKIASMIKGKTAEEIRSTFKITNDFTEEESKRIEEESRWCEPPK